MPAAASIQFTQGATVGTAGVALKGVAGTSVSVANGNNTSVASWKIEMLDVPGGSAVATGTLASNNNSGTPAATFTPDVSGAYRIRLSVWSVINQVGAADDIDIRCFGVPFTNGLIVPPYQTYPFPLTPLADGGTHADECNYSGGASADGRGWAGNQSDGQADAQVKLLDKLNATSINGQFFGNASKSFGYPRAAVAVRGLRIWGHSYSDVAQTTSGFSSIATNDHYWYKILAGALGLPEERVFNHAINGQQFTAVDAHQGWIQALTSLSQVKPVSSWPSVRFGECGVLLSGINDLGNNTAANQTKIVADFTRAARALISLHRASDVFLCQTSSQWAFGSNFSNASNATDFTMGSAKQASVVDSSGTSTATFTIPSGYQGETICFNLVALTGGSLIVTWGGSVTGTTSIVGRTDTLSGLTVNAQGAYPVRFTAAANGLSAANAGQTITVRITTVSGSTFYIDGSWLEAKKPAPFIICNIARLPQKTIAFACGDGVGNGTTTFTSATAAQFASATDSGQAITETDGGGKIPSNTTISSVTNSTTAVLSAAASSGSGIKFTITRKILGYSSNYSTNTDFANATTASHSAADADVDALSTSLTNLQTEFGSMVQVADINAALGNGDQTPPTGQYGWFLLDGLHPNEFGHEALASAGLKAIYALAPEDANDIGTLEIAGSASRYHRSLIYPIKSGDTYGPIYTSWNGTGYTAVVGDMFAIPLVCTQSTIEFNKFIVEQTNAPTTSGSSVRGGIYFDINMTGYPDKLWADLGAFALGTTAGVKTLATMTTRHGKHPFYWLVLRVDVLGTTASVLRQVNGPVYGMPTWDIGGGTGTPAAWKLTGQSVAAGLPNIFPSGGAKVSTAPYLALTQVVF